MDLPYPSDFVTKNLLLLNEKRATTRSHKKGLLVVKMTIYWIMLVVNNDYILANVA